MGFGLGLAAGGMGDELQEILKQKFLEGIQRQQLELQRQRLSEDARQADMSNALGNRNAATGEGNLGLGHDRLTQEKTEYEGGAPDREAARALHAAQTADITRRPQAEQEDFTRDMQKIGLQGGQRLQQIGASGAEDRRTQAQRPTGGDSTGAIVVRPGIGPDGRPALIAVNKMTGQAQPINMPEGFAPNQPARPVTGFERQALAFFNRAKEAEDTITTADASGASLEERIANAGLGSQLQQQHAPNLLQTSEQQQYRQAQRAFTEARLRKESGAAIPNSEFENDVKTYFAQPGDSPEVRAQKKASRETLLKGLRFASGNAYKEFYGDDDQPKSGGGAPKVGDTKQFPNGKVGKWDGHGWVAQ